MRIGTNSIGKLALLSAVFLWTALPSWSQANAQPLITQPVDETKLTVLRGNTHPLARPQFDKGAAPAALLMNHMELVLRRSPEQEAALDQWMAEQQDKSSPNYHKWLTPAEFGERFGPSDQDILAATAWLQSHGFAIGAPSKGKMMIDFSGSASQVEQAFHTAIHKFVVHGEEHWANVSDPSIPTALIPAVVGVASLHNFFPKPQSTVRAASQMRRPLYTLPTGCSQSTSSSNTNPCFYGVSPADFDKIYNVPASLTGSGETIAIVSDSDIALSNNNPTQPSDVNAFRSIFGLPAINFQEIETDPANDPGISGPSGDEVEAVLDVEWSGAIAPSAKIDLVVSPNTATTSGIDTAASYIINTLTPTPPILSVSYGLCELELGTAGNQMHNTMWQQAAAEGITVLVASGDNGSAGCDIDEVPALSQVQPAKFGLEVNGIASTPYDTAVGGTDFNDLSNPATYWGTVNGTTGQSVLGYVPETTWNDTCTNSVVIQAFQGDGFDTGTAASTCNDPQVENATDANGTPFNLVATNGASGGISSCTTSNQSTPSSCSGGYPKPTWQVGQGVPNDGVRDLPDVSLFAADGVISGSSYIDCEEDFVQAPCSLSTEEFVSVGGTSVSTQVMAGIVALLDQKMGATQGNLNPTLYALATQQSAANCNASTPAASCVFNNVTVGTIVMPCVSGSPNCTVTGNDLVGVLTGYNAGTGYNLATGLGSLNVTNLTKSWGPTFSMSSSNPAVTVSSAGGSGSFSVTVTSVNGFAGNVSLACSGLPSGDTCTFSPVSPVALASNGSVSVMVTVQTAMAELRPAKRHWRIGPTLTAPAASTMTFVLLLSVGLLLVLCASGSDKRWIKTALAVATLSTWMALAGCGGGSGGSGGGGGGGTFTANANVTGASGNVTSSVPFVLTVD